MSDNNLSHLAAIRREYQSRGLREADALPDPLAQFAHWMREAVEAEVADPTAMTLSTIATEPEDGLPRPSSRVVLLKGVVNDGFVFYTNYESRKGDELAANPHASLLFFWHELTRQVRIEGSVTKTRVEDSDAYFQSRPFESKVAAWASHQGAVLADRRELDAKFESLKVKFADGHVPTPPHWGGYVLVPVAIEFWAGRENRLHDRLLYTRRGSAWSIARLAP